MFGRTGAVVAATNDYSFSQLSGNISTTQMNSGTGATSSTFWRGDGTWAAPPTGAVTSVFGRTGAIVAATNDYSFTQISGNIATTQMNSGTGATSSTFWRGDGTWAAPPTGAVTSVFGRTGAVVAATNDYSFSQLSGNIATTQMNSGTGASSSTFWRGDGTWATPAGGGNFTGPSSSTTGDLVMFADTSGHLGADSGILSSIATTTGIALQVFPSALTGGDGINISSTTITTGNMLDLQQGTSSFSGNAILIHPNNAGTSSFTGNFLAAYNGAGLKWYVNSQGAEVLNAGLEVNGAGGGISGTPLISLWDTSDTYGQLNESSTVTGGYWLFFNHNTSAFTGDVIYANMAAGSGSFNAGYYEVFAKNGVAQWTIDNAGNVAANGLLAANGLRTISTLSVQDTTGFASGSSAFNSITLGKLQGSYSFFPSGFWSTVNSPLRSIWEINYTDHAAEWQLYAMDNNVSGGSVSYDHSIIDSRMYCSNLDTNEQGCGNIGATSFSEANGVSIGVADFDAEIGTNGGASMSNTGATSLELDMSNWTGSAQPDVGHGDTKDALNIVCGGNNNCSAGIYMYNGAGQPATWSRGIILSGLKAWNGTPGAGGMAMIIQNNIPIYWQNSGASSYIQALTVTGSNDIIIGPTGSFSSGHAACQKSDSSIGFCSTVVSSSGTCTCN